MRAEFSARAATIRNDIYKRVTNVMHEESYKTFFEPESLSANEEQEAGPIPKSWEEWAQTMLRPGQCILGASKRFGGCIIVVPTTAITANDKDRPMMFGSFRTGKEPIVLFLRSGHYQLARLKPGR